MAAPSFEIDLVAHGLVKALGLPDSDEGDARHTVDTITGHPAWDQIGVHEVYRGWRAVLDEYPGSMMVAEAWVEPPERLARYVRPDEFQQAFNFAHLEAPWTAQAQRDVIRASLAADAAVAALLSVLDGLRSLDSGVFLDPEGQPVPW